MEIQKIWPDVRWKYEVQVMDVFFAPNDRLRKKKGNTYPRLYFLWWNGKTPVGSKDHPNWLTFGSSAGDVRGKVQGLIGRQARVYRQPVRKDKSMVGTIDKTFFEDPCDQAYPG